MRVGRCSSDVNEQPKAKPFVYSSRPISAGKCKRALALSVVSIFSITELCGHSRKNEDTNLCAMPMTVVFS